MDALKSDAALYVLDILYCGLLPPYLEVVGRFSRRDSASRPLLLELQPRASQRLSSPVGFFLRAGKGQG